MTTPVYMKNDDNSNTMEFVMPASYDLETISTPNDKNVVIYESEAKHFACIRYGGYSNSGKFNSHSKKLIEKIKKFVVINEEFTIENGMLTPTLKLKRKEIIKNYKQQLENLY